MQMMPKNMGRSSQKYLSLKFWPFGDLSQNLDLNIFENSGPGDSSTASSGSVY